MQFDVTVKLWNILYVPCLLGVYQQYETLAPRYLPSASPRADISGLGSHIADTHLEAMVYIYYITTVHVHDYYDD